MSHHGPLGHQKEPVKVHAASAGRKEKKKKKASDEPHGHVAPFLSLHPAPAQHPAEIYSIDLGGMSNRLSEDCSH